MLMPYEYTGAIGVGRSCGEIVVFPSMNVVLLDMETRILTKGNSPNTEMFQGRLYARTFSGKIAE
jgi:hypothetical protein